MQVRHERPMSDLSFDVRAPLTLEVVGGEKIVIEAWSLTGFTYPGISEIVPSNGLLSIPFQGVDVRFKVELEPGDGPREVKFKGLGGRQRETLAVFYRSILSGKMVSSEDVITSLDTPVDLVPMGETEQEVAIATEGHGPRSFKILWNAMFYAMLSLVVFGLLGSSIYDRLSGIRLQNGRVAAPLVELRVSEASYVDQIHVAIGDRVRVGQVLVSLNNPERDGALDGVRGDIRLAEQRLTDAETRLQQMIARRLAQRDVLVQAVTRAQNALTVRDFIGGYRQQAYLAALAALRSFDTMSLEFEELEAQLRELVQERTNAVRQLKRDLSNAKDAYDALNVISPVDGMVRELPVVKDLYIARGVLAAVVEENRPRQALGWVNERASQSLHVGQAARLRVSSATGSKTMNAVVSDITAGVDPARPGEFGVIVTLDTNQKDLTKNRAALRPDAPVEIQADRGWFLTPFVLAFRSWWS